MKNYRYLNIILAAILIVLTLMVVHAYAENPIQSCTADGNIVYTNKDVKGCTPVKLPELSIVSSYDRHLPQTLKHTGVSSLPIPPTVPPSTSGPINDHLCKLYDEWMKINEETDGGFRFAGASQKTRYNALWRTFSSGFISVDCRL